MQRYRRLVDIDVYIGVSLIGRDLEHRGVGNTL